MTTLRNIFFWAFGLLPALAGAQCPSVAFIYADACEAPDGKGEFMVLDNASDPLAIDDLNLITPSGLEICARCGTQWDEPDVSNLNWLAGCGTLFHALGPGDTLPAEGRLVIFTNRNFKDDVDWSTFCDQAPIYAVAINRVDNTDKYPHNEGSCTAGTATSYLEYGASYSCGTQAVSYEPCSLPVETPTGSGGGHGVVYTAGGALAYREVGCDNFYIDDVALPPAITLTAEQLGSEVQLKWYPAQTAASLVRVESNSSLPVHLGTVTGTDAWDPLPVPGSVRYQLRTIYSEGAEQRSNWAELQVAPAAGAVTILGPNQRWTIALPAVPQGADLQLLNVQGQVLDHQVLSDQDYQLPGGLPSGIYLVTVLQQRQRYSRRIQLR